MSSDTEFSDHGSTIFTFKYYTVKVFSWMQGVSPFRINWLCANPSYYYYIYVRYYHTLHFDIEAGRLFEVSCVTK